MKPAGRLAHDDALDRAAGEGSVSSGADRYQVVLHVSAEPLSDVPAGTPPPEADRSHLERGSRVPAGTSRRLACDGAIVGHLFQVPLFRAAVLRRGTQSFA